MVVAEGATDSVMAEVRGVCSREVEAGLFLCHGREYRTVALRQSDLGEGALPTPLFRNGLCQQHIPLLRLLGPHRGLPEVMSQETVLETLICGQALRLKTREPFLESELG
jgi:hypothetical protein